MPLKKDDAVKEYSQKKGGQTGRSAGRITKRIPDKSHSSEYPRESVPELKERRQKPEKVNGGPRQDGRTTGKAKMSPGELLEILPIGCFSLDDQDRIIEINSMGARLLGGDRPQLLEKSFTLFVDPLSRGRFRAHKKQVLASGNKKTCELTLKTTAGTTFPARLVSIAVPETSDASGKWVSALIAAEKTNMTGQTVGNYERFFQSLSRISPVGIFRTDSSGKYIYVNRLWCEIAGIPEEAVLQNGPDRAIHPQDRNLVKKEWDKSIASGEPFSLEYRFQDKSGLKKWVFGQAIPERNAEGEISGFVGTLTDFSYRKFMEEALLESEEKNRLLLENAGVAIGYFDLNGTLLILNKIGAQYLQGQPENFIGKSLFEIFDPQLAEVVSGRIKKAAGLEKSQIYEDHIKLPIGKKWFLSTYQRIMSANNEATGVQVVINDVSGHKRSDEALRQSEEKYRSIFENASEGIFQTTPEGKLISANPAFARMYGYETPDEMITQVFDFAKQHYVRPADRAQLAELLSKQDLVENFEAELRRKDGRRLWIQESVRAVRNRKGQILFFEGIVEDITKRKQAEEDLRATLETINQSLKGTISALAAASELRDPYTAGHQRRVAMLATAIGKELGLPPDRVQGIWVMGFLHDIGKIVVPAEILNKPAVLNKYEMELIRTHPNASFEILKEIVFPWPVGQAILQHHERIDGSGYPSGLSGDEIMIESRILAVADTVESMASHRPYRPALGIDKALEEISRLRGSLLDPDVVDACLKLFKKRRFSFEKEMDQDFFQPGQRFNLPLRSGSRPPSEK